MSTEMTHAEVCRFFQRRQVPAESPLKQVMLQRWCRHGGGQEGQR